MANRSTSRTWTEAEHGLCVTHEVIDLPVRVHLLGDEIVAPRRTRISVASDGDEVELSRYAANLGFASAEVRPAIADPVHIRETWVVLQPAEGPCVALYALYEAGGGQVAGGLCIEHAWSVGRYDAPRWLFDTLADLGNGVRYTDLRLGTLCDVMHQTIVHHEITSEVHERIEGPEDLHLPTLLDADLGELAEGFVSAALLWGVLAPELATTLAVKSYEGAAYGWRTASLGDASPDTLDTSTLRVAVRGALLGRPVRLIVELIDEGLDRMGVSDAAARAVEMLTLPDTVSHEEPPRLVRLVSGAFLCEPTASLSAALVARTPGLPLSGTPSRGLVPPPLVDLDWARKLLFDEH